MIEFKPIKTHQRLTDITKNMKDGDIRTIKRYGGDILIKKIGFMIYYECAICGDVSRCKIGSSEFCINQHKDEDGKEIQPASYGVNMPGKIWSLTPKGMKKNIAEEPINPIKKGLIESIKDKIKRK